MRVVRTILGVSVAAMLAATSPASALTLADLPFAPDAVVTGVVYRCEGLLDDIYVSYVNDTYNSVAVVPVPGILDDPVLLVFASVAAASGVRYVSGTYVWWTSGPEASLYDVRNGDDAAPMTICHEVPAP